MAPIWLPVWRIEKINGLCSGRDRRASSVELAGVSGPNAKPRMAPGSDEGRRAAVHRGRHGGGHGQGTQRGDRKRSEPRRQHAAGHGGGDADSEARSS